MAMGAVRASLGCDVTWKASERQSNQKESGKGKLKPNVFMGNWKEGVNIMQKMCMHIARAQCNKKCMPLCTKNEPALLLNI